MGMSFRHLIDPSARLIATTSPVAPLMSFLSNRMLLQPTSTRSPATVGPAQGFSFSGVSQATLPSSAFRQASTRLPTRSASMNADAASTPPAGDVHRRVHVPLALALLPEELGRRLRQRLLARRDRQVPVLGLVLLVLRLQRGPALVHQLLDAGQVDRLAVERHRLEVHADDPRVPAADVDPAGVDRRGAFEVDELARQVVLPDRPAGVGAEAVERRAVRLVHPVAEHDQPVHHGRRGDGRQLDERRGLRPERPVAGRGVERQRVERRGVERAEARGVQGLARGHGRGDEVLRGPCRPSGPWARTGRAGRRGCQCDSGSPGWSASWRRGRTIRPRARASRPGSVRSARMTNATAKTREYAKVRRRKD